VCFVCVCEEFWYLARGAARLHDQGNDSIIYIYIYIIHFHFKFLYSFYFYFYILLVFTSHAVQQGCTTRGNDSILFYFFIFFMFI